jgi:ankyrin repeat protein
LTTNQKPLVNTDKRDDQGRTALHHAVMANRIANVKLLLDYQACIAVGFFFSINKTQHQNFNFLHNKI